MRAEEQDEPFNNAMRQRYDVHGVTSAVLGFVLHEIYSKWTISL
jgi:hypothetical protein